MAPDRAQKPEEAAAQDTTLTSRWRDFKRRKRRHRPCNKQGKQASGDFNGSIGRKHSMPATAAAAAFIFTISWSWLTMMATHQLASANEIMPPAGEFPDGSELLPEPQPLVYSLLMREFGSGDGSFAGPARPGSQRLDLSSSSSSSPASSSSVSPSLIEARCWNNYESDNDCKHLNVITAPNADELLRRKQQQSAFGADNIITPVVIFEAASTIEPEAAQPDEGAGLFTGHPPYQTSEQQEQQKQQQQQPRRPNDQFAGPPQSATLLPPTVQFERPVTRPSIKNSFIYVATPQPKGRRPPGAQNVKTTTIGRKCRDDEDADCDEPDDESRDQNSIGSGSSGRDDEADDDNSIKPEMGSSSSSATSTLEPGSGGFAPTDDNDDSTDDQDDQDDDSNATDDNNIDESSGSPPDESTQPPQLVEVTSVFAAGEPGDGGSPTATTSGQVSTSTRQHQTGAEIEVVVHSTLPPSFPISTPPASSSSTTTTTPPPTTQPPDDVFTSRPIFPPSSEAPAAENSAVGEGGAPPGHDELGPANSREQAPATTTELDLYTFKPIPIPVEQSPSRYNQRQQQQHYGYEQAVGKPPSSGAEQQEVSSQNIFKRPPMYESGSGGRNSFDDGWTTRRPANQQSQLNAREHASGQYQPSMDPFASSNQKQVGARKGHIGTDMLPTLLLYASIIVLVATALIFAIMVYVFWRRNTLRRQNLLQKARLLNGMAPAAGPHAAHLAQSISQASQLHRGAGPPGAQPQGLLSTYAPGKGMSMGKVTTSLAKPVGRAPSQQQQQNFIEDEEDESAASNQETNGQAGRQAFNKNSNSKGQFEDGDERAQTRAPPLNRTSGHLNQQSWSTDEPTTSSSSNPRAAPQDQQQERQNSHQLASSGQAAHGPPSHYPNSLSDGRQNSSSISDSQCSPDGASLEPGQAPPMQTGLGPPGQPHNPNGLGPQPQAATLGHLNPRHQMQPARMPAMGPAAFGHQMLMRPVYSANGVDSSASRAAFGPQAMMMPANGFSSPIKMPMRLPAASRSIEDLQLSASSSHVGFVTGGASGQPLALQQQVPYGGQQAAMLPLMRGSRPQMQMAGPFNGAPLQQQYQMGAYPGANFGAGMQTAALAFPQAMMSPRSLAMNPLATLGRRYGPGAGLNRNIYSEDSSSFMTTSPSLARTSSSSSFAFNLAKHQPTSSESPPSVTSISSIKAKPLVDPTTGRMINDYTNNNSNNMQQPFDGHAASNGNASSTGPPVFGRRDRSEAWYV